jgi:bacterioferritin-associated ferredoxin
MRLPRIDSSFTATVWNHFKKPFFLLPRAAQSNIDPSSLNPPGSMIVCSCNVISDHDVRHAVSTADELPRNAKEVYGCLGCSVACGRCARTIKTIVDEALGPCARQCRDGCEHDRTSMARDELTSERFALAAA